MFVIYYQYHIKHASVNTFHSNMVETPLNHIILVAGLYDRQLTRPRRNYVTHGVDLFSKYAHQLCADGQAPKLIMLNEPYKFLLFMYKAPQ